MKSPKGLFSTTIQTKPYLRKYLHCLYGQPLMFTTDNYFGMSIAAFLSRPPLTFHKPKEELKQRTDKFTDTLQVFFPLNFLRNRRRFEMTDAHTICLNKLFETRFTEDLYKWCELGTIYKVEYKKNIEDFCWRHKISIGEEADDDITFDALKKKEYRYRIKQQLETLSRETNLAANKVA